MNIFFALGRSQSLFYEQIISTTEERERTILVSMFLSDQAKVSKKFIYVGGSSYFSKVKNALVAFWALTGIRQQIKNLYSPHCAYWLVSYLLKKPKIKFNLCYDGILNIRDVSMDSEQIHQYCKRQKRLSNLFGQKYLRPEGDLYNSLNQEIATGYFPELLVDHLRVRGLEKENIKLIEIPTTELPYKEKVAFLLEQPFLNTKMSLEFVTKLRAYCERYEIATLYIKPHPMLRKSSFSSLSSEFSEITVKILTEDKAAENLVLSLSPEHIISTNSSALILCKALAPNSKVVSIGPQLSTNPDEIDQLISLFRSLKIEVEK